MLELRELQNFVAVAERLNVTSAAKAVHLSQPALSRQIQALERKLGVALFERIGKRIILTVEGDDLLKHASTLLDQAQTLINRAYDLEQGHVGLLRVGASPQTIAWLLSPVMAEFQRQHPNVELVFSEGHNEALVEMVENGSVHIAVASPAQTHNLVGTPLFQAGLFAFLPPEDPRRQIKTLTMDQLADDRFLLLRRGFLTRQMFDLACSAARVRPSILLESDSTHTLISLARDGHGIAILSSSARDTEDIKQAVPLVSSEGEFLRTVSAIWNPNRYRPASLPVFAKMLEKHAAQDSAR